MKRAARQALRALALAGAITGVPQLARAEAPAAKVEAKAEASIAAKAPAKAPAKAGAKADEADAASWFEAAREGDVATSVAIAILSITGLGKTTPRRRAVASRSRRTNESRVRDSSSRLVSDSQGSFGCPSASTA